MSNGRSVAAMGNALKLYNTLSRKVEPLETIEPGVVRMYVCGVTPYDNAHIGHAMSAIVFDMIRRYLEYRGYEVRHVVNFTDIDDKIIVRAQREGIAASELTERLIADWHLEQRSAGRAARNGVPTGNAGNPRDRDMIAGLIDQDHAYEADGDVYFRVRTSTGTASFRAARWTIWFPARASKSMSARKTRLISHSGRQPNPASRLAEPLERWPSRLAHRMLCHVLTPLERPGGHSWRGYRPDLSPPRKRDRSVRSISRRRAIFTLLAT